MIELSEIPAILRRHTGWLIVCPLVFAALALAYAVLKTPVYQATTQLLIQPDGVQILATEPAQPPSDQSVKGMDLDSQIFVILSAGVLNEIVNTLHLDDNASFQRPDLLQRLFGLLTGGLAAGEHSSTDARNATLAALRKIIQVYRLDRSFVFAITVSHPDPQLAAAIANETARAYIDQTRSSRSDALARASQSLSKQAGQLRARVETAETAVETYKAQQGLISTAGGSMVGQQLEALNTQITTARVDLDRIKALYDQMAPLTLSDVEAGSVPPTTGNSVLNSLRVQYARAAQQEAEAAATLGTNHPTLRELRSQLANTKREIQSELQRIKQSVRSQYEQAQATVNALEQRSRSLQSETTTQGKALIELRQLQSEADTSRAIYEAFLKRSRELGELPDLDTSATRILSEAPVPSEASGPHKLIVLAAALVFGFAVAASGAVGATLLKGTMVTERLLVARTGAPILASLTAPSRPGRFLVTLPGLGPPARRSPDHETAIASARVAYAIRHALAETRPANILALSVGQSGIGMGFVRSLAEELHNIGEDVLFAQTATGPKAAPSASLPPQKGGQPGHPGQSAREIFSQMATKFSGPAERLRQDTTTTTGEGLSSFLQVEQIDSRRKYASGGDLATSNDDIFLVDAGHIDESPVLPVLLRHCDGIVLITAQDGTSAAEFERSAAFLEPWHERIIGHVVLKPD